MLCRERAADVVREWDPICKDGSVMYIQGLRGQLLDALVDLLYSENGVLSKLQ